MTRFAATVVDLTTRDDNAIGADDVFAWVRLDGAESLSAVCAREGFGHELVAVEVGRLPESDITEKHDERLATIRAAIATGELCEVSKVDALSEAVPRARGFRRSDAETLGKDADVVGETAAVPKEHAVAKTLLFLEAASRRCRGGS